MANFIIYDLVFLVLFVSFIFIFLYIKKNNLKREGLLYLYRTKFGLEIIEYTSKKFSKILKPLQYLTIASGYALMAFMVYTLLKFTYIYVSSPEIAKAIKMPVIMPLIPYLPELFKISFLPPFYFTYWIIIIAIIAIPHEFAHGIFARLNKIRVHSTGFGFLGPFLAAFVEPDEKQTEKANKFSQLSILSAGTFANVLTAIVFGLLLWGFFATAFSPTGLIFSSYSLNSVNTSSVSLINGIPLSNFTLSNLNVTDQNLMNITANNQTFFTTSAILSSAFDNNTLIIAFEDSPAFRAKLEGAITEFNNTKITSEADLSDAILSTKPGDKVRIKTINETGDITEYNITLGNENGTALLGIGVPIISPSSGMLGKVYSIIAKIRNPVIYYQSNLGDFGTFIYDLLWWIVLISISVALANMLPLGIFDGGRFFFLTIWGITGSKKIGETAFKLSTWFILALIALMMVKWLFAIF